MLASEQYRTFVQHSVVAPGVTPTGGHRSPTGGGG